MLIGLNGRLGAGKDTAAQALIDWLTPEWEVRTKAFAHPLKQSAAALFGLTLAELETLKLDDHYSFSVLKPDGEAVLLTGRQYLERYGTEAHRDVFGQSFWLDQALPLGTNSKDEILIFTDCRFPNEAERIRANGGVVVEIVGVNGREGNGHPSDTKLPNDLIDYFVDNTEREDDGTMRHLRHGLWKVLVQEGLL